MGTRKKQQAEKQRRKTLLTAHEVELVRQLRDDGLSFSQIAEKMEIGKATAVEICHFKYRR